MFIPYRLEPCPFCGSLAEVKEFPYHNSDLSSTYVCEVVCSACQANISRWYSNPDVALRLAVDSWNSRANEEVLI